MGLLKLQFQVVVLTLVSFLTLPFLPIPFDFEPEAYTVSFPAFEGPLAKNTIIDQNSKIFFQNTLRGPESLAHKDGFIYTGTKFGDVWKINLKSMKAEKLTNTGNGCKGVHDEEKCGRVLGMRFDKNGNLYAADANMGLLKIDPNTGKITVLIKQGEYIGSQRLKFSDDLDIDDDGVIYMSDGSTKWGLHQVVLTMIEHDNSGRIITYDTKTGKKEVLIQSLYFPNGITISHDKQSLIFAEIGKHRVMQYGLKGANKGKLSVFNDKLPGGPDNIRPSPSGGYWVAIEASRQSFNILDVIAPYPLLGKATVRFTWLIAQGLRKVQEFVKKPELDAIIADFEHGKILAKFMPKAGIVVELDKSGKIIRSLQSEHLSLYSEAVEVDGFMYIGSVIHDYIIRVKMP